MDETAHRAAVAKARALLAESSEFEHDHRGPEPCPRCGGEPPEPAPVTSWHPGDNVIPLRQRIEESE